jgi:hypothetical protein
MVTPIADPVTRAAAFHHTHPTIPVNPASRYTLEPQIAVDHCVSCVYPCCEGKEISRGKKEKRKKTAFHRCFSSVSPPCCEGRRAPRRGATILIGAEPLVKKSGTCHEKEAATKCDRRKEGKSETVRGEDVWGMRGACVPRVRNNCCCKRVNSGGLPILTFRACTCAQSS